MHDEHSTTEGINGDAKHYTILHMRHIANASIRLTPNIYVTNKMPKDETNCVSKIIVIINYSINNSNNIMICEQMPS